MTTRLNLPLIGLLVCVCSVANSSPVGHLTVGTVKSKDSFAIVQNNVAAILWVDALDFPGVLRAANDLQKDIARVTGRTPAISHAAHGPGMNAIMVGTLGKSVVIENLIREHKIDV